MEVGPHFQEKMVSSESFDPEDHGTSVVDPFQKEALVFLQEFLVDLVVLESILEVVLVGDVLNWGLLVVGLLAVVPVAVVVAVVAVVAE